MFLSSIEKRWETLNTCAAKAEEVLVSTYNLYTGVDKHGNLVQSTKTRPARNFMRLVNKPTTKVLVGVPPFYPCAESCPECQENRNNLITRYVNHLSRWDQMDMRFARELHLKLFLFKIEGKWYGFTGGVNLSVSEWDDILIRIPDEDMDEALAYFHKLWERKPEEIEILKNWSLL